MRVVLRSRRSILAVAGIAAITTLAVIGGGHAQQGRALGEETLEQVAQGLAITPVPLNVQGKDRFLVGLGSYIVNAHSGCSCHTCPEFLAGGDPFKGQPTMVNTLNFLGGGRHFGATLVAPNITPVNGLPGGLTLAEFIGAMRTGADPDVPGRILQVMPWPTFRHMTDRDLKAIYAYLSAIPPAQKPDQCFP